MLSELRVRDFAVIDEVSVELGAGLNVLTGETGAGKSILVGALSLLLGERASSESVRQGSERGVVEAVFDLEGRESVRERVREGGYDLDDDLLILRREVWREGRNRAWVNGSPAPAGVVGDFGRRLINLHGQHEHQTLLEPAEQRRILDARGDATRQAARVRELHAEREELATERSRRQAELEELRQKQETLGSQLEEIEGTEIQPGEDGELEERARRLENSEELARGASELHRALYGGEGSISDRLSELRPLIRELGRMDPDLEPQAAELEDLFHRTAELGRTLGSYESRVDHDPSELERIRSRLDHLARLRRKYGPELEDVVEMGRKLRRELESLEEGEFELAALDRRLESLHEELRKEAEALSRLRSAAARQLEEEMEDVLPGLGMEGGRFRVALKELEDVGPGGAEGVEFLVSLNPGFDPGPLSRVASGGELSRVMLALKAILAREDRVPTLVFDEIDAGIGGVVAGRVAERLREVAEHHQVLVITHLPQLASQGDRHLHVDKVGEGGRTSVRVTDLLGEDRVREVARLLGGDPDSKTSRDHARELLGKVPTG